MADESIATEQKTMENANEMLFLVFITGNGIGWIKQDRMRKTG